jgi:hypothetical protein
MLTSYAAVSNSLAHPSIVNPERCAAPTIASIVPLGSTDAPVP